jgi:hypothetical protein
MKTTLFIRPNLKMFLLAALFIAVLKECVIPADSSPLRASIGPLSQSATGPSDEALEQILSQTLSDPTSRHFAYLSECYQKRGEFRQAMLCLRKAFLAADLEEAED